MYHANKQFEQCLKPLLPNERAKPHQVRFFRYKLEPQLFVPLCLRDLVVVFKIRTSTLCWVTHLNLVDWVDKIFWARVTQRENNILISCGSWPNILVSFLR